jgi:hypothetical protein
VVEGVPHGVPGQHVHRQAVPQQPHQAQACLPHNTQNGLQSRNILKWFQAPGKNLMRILLLPVRGVHTMLKFMEKKV